MGMFDHIKFETECPNCKEKVDGFQSKDGPCCLYVLDFWEVDNFYTSCEECKCWIEYRIRKRENRKLTINDYEQMVKENE